MLGRRKCVITRAQVRASWVGQRGNEYRVRNTAHNSKCLCYQVSVSRAICVSARANSLGLSTTRKNKSICIPTTTRMALLHCPKSLKNMLVKTYPLLQLGGDEMASLVCLSPPLLCWGTLNAHKENGWTANSKGAWHIMITILKWGRKRKEDISKKGQDGCREKDIHLALGWQTLAKCCVVARYKCPHGSIFMKKDIF